MFKYSNKDESTYSCAKHNTGDLKTFLKKELDCRNKYYQNIRAGIIDDNVIIRYNCSGFVVGEYTVLWGAKKSFPYIQSVIEEITTGIEFILK